jgi:very-short-patch-repair endonuclease
MHIDRQRAYARNLRKHMTGAETLLWSRLRGRRLQGFRFNRQVEIGPFIVDFLCRETSVIVEVDGVTHSDARDVAADARRTEYLQGKGFVVFRVWNSDVYANLDGVLDGLLQILESRTRGHTPSPLRGTPPSQGR